MQGNTERWRYLCELASVEQNPDKLIELVKEINELLQQKRERLKARRQDSDAKTDVTTEAEQNSVKPKVG